MRRNVLYQEIIVYQRRCTVPLAPYNRLAMTEACGMRSGVTWKVYVLEIKGLGSLVGLSPIDSHNK